MHNPNGMVPNGAESLPQEASALFSEESCSFSRTDLARSLQEWVAATERLPGS